jgi:hypothetical protein
MITHLRGTEVQGNHSTSGSRSGTDLSLTHRREKKEEFRRTDLTNLRVHLSEVMHYTV